MGSAPWFHLELFEMCDIQLKYKITIKDSYIPMDLYKKNIKRNSRYQFILHEQ